MTIRFFKTLFISFLSSSLIMLHAEDVPAPIKNENMLDSLTMSAVGMLATNLSSYTQTNDVAIASAGGSAFISGDVLATAETKELNVEAMDDFNGAKGSNPDQKQVDAILTLRESYQTALDAAQNKLTFQNASSASFGAAAVAALELAKKELAQEKKCTAAIAQALGSAAAGVSKTCSDMSNDPAQKDEAQNCSNELSACSAKINTDKTQMDTYLKTRNTPIASIEGFKKVSELGDVLVANLPGSAEVCSNYSKAMAAAEASGKCGDKIAFDEKNESSGKLDPSIDGDLLGSMGIDSKSASAFISVAGKSISKDLDLNMLIPEHRAIIWEGMKELADSASSATSAEIEKIEAIIVKVDKYLAEIGKLPNGVSLGSDGVDAKKGELPWTDKQIKDYAATNPSVDDVRKKIAGFSDAQIASLYKVIAGNPADVAKLDQAKVGVSESTGSIQTSSGQYISKAEIKAFYAKGPTAAEEIVKAKELGLTPVQMTQAQFIGVGVDINRVHDNVLESAFYNNSVALGKDMGPPWAPKNYYSLTKGDEISAQELKGFFDSKPSDAQILGKASELGIGIGAMTSLMKVVGQNDYTLMGSSDNKYGSLYNRFDTSLYQGRDGYSLDEQRHIIKGGGNIEIKDAGGSSHWEPRTNSVAWTPVLNPSGITLAAISKSKVKTKTKVKVYRTDFKLAHNLPCVTVGNDQDACPSFSKSLNQSDLNSMSSVVKDHVGNISKMADSLNGAKKFSKESLEAAKLVGSQRTAISSELEKLKSVSERKANVKFLAVIRAAVQSELDSKKMTAEEMQASFSSLKKPKAHKK